MIFYDILADYYDELFPVSNTQYNFIKSLIDNEDTKILDVGCATGELLCKLSEYYNNLTGIDTSSKMIKIAKNKHTATKINFISTDLTNLSNVKYNAILCMGNTLVHFESPDKIASFLKSVYNLLEPAGSFTAQILNYDKIINKSINDLPDIETKNTFFRRKYKNLSLKNKIIFHTELELKNGKSYKNNIFLYPLLKDEIINLLEITGFKDIKLFGSFTKKYFDKTSDLLIFSAKKLL